jgi:hypothetical protein
MLGILLRVNVGRFVEMGLGLRWNVMMGIWVIKMVVTVDAM